MSDIEKDIKRCEKLTEPQNANWIGISNQMAIAGALARIKELEEEKKAMCEEYCPKTERIKELEEALLKVKDKNVELFIHYKNSILKTKIKDLIENETINISGFKCIEVEDIEELLEDK